MDSAPLLDVLTSYAPAFVLQRIAVDPAPIEQPRLDRLRAAVLFVDISGFTALTERLNSAGAGSLGGAEALSRLLNNYFGLLIELVTAHGGDVVKFAGDALLALWPDENDDLTTAVHRAAQCGQAMQESLHGYEVAEGIRLAVHMGLDAGIVVAAHIGGIYGRWELLLGGTPLTQMSQAARQARPGQLILAPQAARLLQGRCGGYPLASGAFRLEGVTGLKLQPLAAPSPPALAEAALRAYIPGAILSRLQAGQSDWLAELRRVSVIFVNLPDAVGEQSARGGLLRAHQIMQTLQQAIYLYEGSVNKLYVDDKGATLVAALGLPPLAHEDDAVRAVHAAVEIQRRLHSLGWRSSIGIATGTAFCGAIGNNRRREYTMIGDVINLAARLMQVAREADHGPGVPIFCDGATYRMAQHRLAFTELAPVYVKGKAEPVAIYRPSPSTTAPGASLTAAVPAVAPTGRPDKPPLVGRGPERQLLAEAVRRLLERPDPPATRIIVIEGEAGIGKSRLVEFLQSEAEAHGASYLIGAGDAVEKTTPYNAWRAIFRWLFKLDELPENATLRRRRVLDQLASQPELQPLLPLLEAVLPLEFGGREGREGPLDGGDNELTGQMTGQVRADNIRDLLLRLLQTAVAGEPRLIILEDAHWLDSASWALVRLASLEVRPLLLVISTRPAVEPVPAEYRQIMADPATTVIRLNALSPDDALLLVCRRLGVPTLPEPVAHLIRQKAEGHPFFSEELAYALRDSGLILIETGLCRLAPEAGDLSSLTFPNTIQGVITSRIDRLPPPQQLALKVASVIGRIFSFHVLRDIHPIEADKPKLAEYLVTLEQLDITPLETPEPELAYIFKHIITRDVAYNLMLYSQRQQLHRAAAEWYERTQQANLASHYSILAYHWRSTGSRAKTVEYMGKAGEQALRSGAYQEAAEFFFEALALSGTHDVKGVYVKGVQDSRSSASHSRRQKQGLATPYASPLNRARWQRLLAEAYLGLGRLADSHRSFKQVSATLGQPAPENRAALMVSLLKNVAIQALHRCWPARFIGRVTEPEAQAALREMAQANAMVGEIYYMESQKIQAIYGGLRALNEAEQAGPSQVLARAYASMCVAAGVVGLHRLGNEYRRQAQAIAREMNHLPTLANVLKATSVYGLGMAEWQRTEPELQQAVDIHRRLGDWRQLGDSLTFLGRLTHYQGQFVRSRAIRQELYEVACRAENRLHQAWGLYGQVESIVRLGYPGYLEQSLQLLAQSVALLDERPNVLAQLNISGLFALLYLRQGHYQQAQQEAESLLKILTELSPTSVTRLDGCAAMADVFLSLWEVAGANVDSQIIRASRQSCRILHQFGRPYLLGRPRAWLFQGICDWLSGHPAKARQAWRKSLDWARRLSMPYDEGLAHYEIGRHWPPGSAAREQHLTSARAIFERLQAEYDLNRLSSGVCLNETQPL
jgi:class 3 adenylate cyclase/tetratricopeptide (TPR) repeat protein